jgi:hypothetical protein
MRLWNILVSVGFKKRHGDLVIKSRDEKSYAVNTIIFIQAKMFIFQINFELKYNHLVVHFASFICNTVSYINKIYSRLIGVHTFYLFLCIKYFIKTYRRPIHFKILKPTTKFLQQLFIINIKQEMSTFKFTWISNIKLKSEAGTRRTE